MNLKRCGMKRPYSMYEFYLKYMFGESEETPWKSIIQDHPSGLPEYELGDFDCLQKWNTVKCNFRIPFATLRFLSVNNKWNRWLITKELWDMEGNSWGLFLLPNVATVLSIPFLAFRKSRFPHSPEAVAPYPGFLLRTCDLIRSQWLQFICKAALRGSYCILT